jgi:hypothetical protein
VAKKNVVVMKRSPLFLVLLVCVPLVSVSITSCLPLSVLMSVSTTSYLVLCILLLLVCVPLVSVHCISSRSTYTPLVMHVYMPVVSAHCPLPRVSLYLHTSCDADLCASGDTSLLVLSPNRTRVSKAKAGMSSVPLTSESNPPPPCIFFQAFMIFGGLYSASSDSQTDPLSPAPPRSMTASGTVLLQSADSADCTAGLCAQAVEYLNRRNVPLHVVDNITAYVESLGFSQVSSFNLEHHIALEFGTSDETITASFNGQCVKISTPLSLLLALGCFSSCTL